MISHDHKLIFIHVPKCGGRSVCELFKQRFDHFTAQYYMSEYPEQWATYTKFTIVRNPFARFVSMYFYLKNHRRHSMEPVFSHPRCKKDTEDFRVWLGSNLRHRKPYDLESPEGMRGTDHKLGSAFWFSSQSARIGYKSGSPISVDRIFKLEDGMIQVEKFLSKQIGAKVKVPHLNPGSGRDYREFYNDTIIELLNKSGIIQNDLNDLNYTFL